MENRGIQVQGSMVFSVQVMYIIGVCTIKALHVVVAQ